MSCSKHWPGKPRNRLPRTSVPAAAAILGAALFVLPALSLAANRDPGLIVVQDQGTMVTFAGGNAKASGAGTVMVRVAGPDGNTVFESKSANGLVDWVPKGGLKDGFYRYDVWFVPAARLKSKSPDASRPPASGDPGGAYESGTFKVDNGLITQMPASEGRSISDTAPGFMSRIVGTALNLMVPEAKADTFTADVTVSNSAPDYFWDDTDTTGTQWEMGLDVGSSDMHVVSNTGSGNPIIGLQRGAPTNSLFIDNTGEIGMGTATPDTNLEIHDSFFPNISLIDEDNSNFDWEMLNNDGYLVFCDRTTGGGHCPLWAHAGSDHGLLQLTPGGVLIGGPIQTSASSLLHVSQNDGTAATIEAQTTGGSVTPRRMLFLVNNGDPLLRLNNTNNASTWDFRTTSNGFSITKVGTGQLEAEVRNNGDFAIAGSYLTSSSRSLKQDIVPVDGSTVLAKLDTLPVAEWQYIHDPAERHVGPMAEDFYATFGLGPDNKHVVAADMAGVALAAAKATNAELKAESASKDKEISALEARVARLEQLVEQGQ